MAQIDITPLGDDRFRVEVSEGGSRTRHEVTVRRETVSALGWPGTLEELVRRSFEFLLAREPKESILHSFDLSVIGRYFPEYEGMARDGFGRR
ncbi:MAG TPA: hypothetical protein VII47_11500 [Actinomycetota bacterium]